MDMQTAIEHHRAGRLAEAVQIYQQILQDNPDHPDALHLMGKAAARLGDADLALALIARAHVLAPDHPGYLLSLGAAQRALGLYAEALASYAYVLAADPRNASAYFGIANTQQAMGRVHDALASFAQVLELNPEFIEARYNLANLEKSLGHYRQAIDHYRLAVEVLPDFYDAHHNLGSALHALGRLDDALASYRRALGGNLPETHNNIGTIHFEQGRFEESLACYLQALALYAGYAEAHNNLGNALCQLGRYDEAQAAYEAAVRIQPGYALAHLNLGVLKSRRDDLPAARDCFARAAACDEGYVDAAYNLGVVHGRLLQPAEAERCYRRVLELDPEHVDAHINLSAILIDDERREEGRLHLDRAYTRQNVFVKYADGARRTVLILFDAGKGNMNLSHLFNEQTNNIIDWMIAYASADQAASLPHYDVVFNAMGDPDLTLNTGLPMQRFLEVCRKPLLNHPALVARTARDHLPALLDGIENLLVPAVWRCADSDQWLPELAQQLPLLIRPIHSHGGVGLALAHTSEELAQLQAQHDGPVYVSRYVDYRSADGWFRKYRMIYIDRKPYPYHLAISPNWVVHYYNAGMAEHAWKLDEEKIYLDDPQRVLGAAGMRAIEAIGARMDLDYAGIDFTLLPDGRILVFEANPTMLAHPERPDGPLAHKNVAVQRIFAAFEALLERAADGTLSRASN